MPRSTTGLTANSPQSFVVDAGAVYLNYGLPTERKLGATRGGSTFVIEQEVRSVEVDGAKGPTMGTRRIVESIARINANLMELTTENIMLAIAATTSTPTNEDGTVGTTHDSIRRTREIGPTDYLENVAIVGNKGGTNENFVGLLYNVLADGGFSVEQNDRDEAVVEVQFTAHFDPADMTIEPWEIRNPIVPADVVAP